MFLGLTKGLIDTLIVKKKKTVFYSIFMLRSTPTASLEWLINLYSSVWTSVQPGESHAQVPSRNSAQNRSQTKKSCCEVDSGNATAHVNPKEPESVHQISGNASKSC